MVDINTAMAAAATERRKRGKGDEKKRSRSGSDLGIESFDPAKHVAKEKADAASMWLVICFAVLVAIIMRYLIMPSAQEKADLLWFLPMSLILLIPSIHRAVMPESFVEHYTKGTWFKASFLHIFCWLAVTFLLSNPPFGDIVAPQVDGSWGVAMEGEDGWEYSSAKKGAVTLETGYSNAWILFSFSDNSDPSDSTYSLSEGYSNNASFYDNMDESFVQKVRPHPDIDAPFAVLIPDDLSVGTHEIIVEVTEQGSPWENTRTVTLKVKIVEPVVEEPATE
ncbi:MAG: hypothetical protein NZ737_02670 [Candidatus Poseidoniaceae archaeon]|nr:hypothetical protein [Candidatus Poseidoniaceae archaeon]